MGWHGVGAASIRGLRAGDIFRIRSVFAPDLADDLDLKIVGRNPENRAFRSAPVQADVLCLIRLRFQKGEPYLRASFSDEFRRGMSLTGGAKRRLTHLGPKLLDQAARRRGLIRTDQRRLGYRRRCIGGPIVGLCRVSWHTRIPVGSTKQET